MAFHPSYETNGFFFVYYTLPDLSLEVARYQVNAVNPNLADPGSKVVVLNIPHPTFSNHNGGKLLFGADGYLYLGTGDGGGGGDPNAMLRTAIPCWGKCCG
jgi:glucose/arabinose dehydrogenase